MKNRTLLVTFFSTIALILGSYSIPGQRSTSLSSIGMNLVEGRITDESNMPVHNAYVELYSNLGVLVAAQRSTTQGRFSFRGMGPGRYSVRVKPYNTNLEEQSQEIEINNQASHTDIVTADFRLKPDRRFRQYTVSIVETVFAQEVPDEAKRLYRSGIDEIGTNRDKAIASLERAVKLSPNYFDALAALGKALIFDGKYETGYPFLIRAIDVYSKCGDCYYGLALAFSRLDQVPAAVKAIDAAALLKPNLPVVRLLQGLIYRLDGDLPRAEKALLMANSLFKEPNPEVHWQLSLVYNRLKRNQDAANQLESYLKAKPDADNAEKRSVRDLITKLRSSKNGG